MLHLSFGCLRRLIDAADGIVNSRLTRTTNVVIADAAIGVDSGVATDDVCRVLACIQNGIVQITCIHRLIGIVHIGVIACAGHIAQACSTCAGDFAAVRVLCGTRRFAFKRHAVFVDTAIGIFVVFHCTFIGGLMCTF